MLIRNSKTIICKTNYVWCFFLKLYAARFNQDSFRNLIISIVILKCDKNTIDVQNTTYIIKRCIYVIVFSRYIRNWFFSSHSKKHINCQLHFFSSWKLGESVKKKCLSRICEFRLFAESYNFYKKKLYSWSPTSSQLLLKIYFFFSLYSSKSQIFVSKAIKRWILSNI